jgi:hypothetical protein
MRFAGMALDGGNYVNAAKGAGSAMDSIIAKNTPDYGLTSNTASAGQSQQRVAAMDAQAMVQNAGINGLASAQQGAFGAQSTLAQGEAAASATRSQGLSNMISSIGGGIMSGLKPKFEYGKTKMGAGGGVLDGYGTLGPNYGIRQ